MPRKTRKGRKKRKKKEINPWPIVTAVVVVAVAIFLVFTLKPVKKEIKPTEQGNVSSEIETIIATIGNEKITKKEFDVMKTLYAPVLGQNYNDGKVLYLLVQQKLLVNYIKNLGIKLNEEEFQKSLQQQFAAFNGTEGFKEQLNALGLDYDAFISLMKENFLIRQYLQEELNKITVSEKEIEEFYNENQFLFGNKTLEEVRDLINATIKEQKNQEFVKALIDELKNKTEIKMGENYTKYEKELCVLDKNIGEKIIFYTAPKCEKCNEVKAMIENITSRYYIAYQDDPVLDCFSKELQKIGYAVPTLICYDGSLLVAPKEVKEIEEFISACR